MSYNPTDVGSSASIEELGESVDRELRRIAEALAEITNLTKRNTEPPKPRPGDITYADGSDWDPGGGEGAYIYGSGGWTKLQTGAFQAENANLTAIAALTTMPYGRALLELANQAALLTTIGTATTSQEGVVELATASEIWAATTGKLIEAGLISSSVSRQTLTDAATIALNWISGIDFGVTLTADRALGNPTNEIVGTYRTVLVQGNDGTSRTLTFGSEYEGDVPVIDDITSSRWYRIYIECIGSGHFAASAKRVLGS